MEAATQTCPHCHNPIPPDAEACPHCKRPLAVAGERSMAVAAGGDVDISGTVITGDVSGVAITGQVYGDVTVQVAPRIEIPPPPEPVHPPDVTGFVGREAELAYFADRLASIHLAVITGMPGVGKTALAAALARRIHDPAKTFWHAFHKDEGISVILWKLAGFLAWHGQAGLWEMLQSAQRTGGQPPPPVVLFDYLFQMLRGHGYLVCLDDFQFVEDDPLLEQFVERPRQPLAASDLSLIIVSQRMPEFAQADGFEALPSLSADDTRALIAQSELSLPDELIDELHAYTGGNAQFLILAIDALRGKKDPARLITRLTETDNIERYLLSQVDETLTGEDRQGMSAVAVLLGYAGTRDAIEAVLDGENVRRVLSDLSQRHLLIVSEGEAGREYSANAIVCAFYYDALSKRERQAMHRRAGAYYETEEPDRLRAALHFEGAGEAEKAAQLATADVWALINQGQARPVSRLLERFTAQGLEPLTWAAVNIARGQVCALLGEGQLARAGYQAALAQLDKLPASPAVREMKARACHGMGDFLQYESPQEALDWLRRGLDELGGPGDSSTEAGHRLEEAALHIKLGSVQIALGDYDEALDSVLQGRALLSEGPSQLHISALSYLGTIYAETYIQGGQVVTLEALQMAEALHDYVRMATIQGNLALDKETLGDWAGAAADYTKALELAEQLGGIGQQATLTNYLGVLHVRQGNDEQALTYLSRSLELARGHNLKEDVLYALSSLADLQVRMGDWEAATRSLKEAEPLALEIDVKQPLAEIYRSWAQVSLAGQQPQAALEQAQKSLQVARDLRLGIEEGAALRVLGQAQWADGQREAALGSFEESLQVLADQDPYEAARTRLEWGRCLVAPGGDAGRGQTLLQEARETFQRLGAQRDLAAVEAALQNQSIGG